MFLQNTKLIKPNASIKLFKPFLTQSSTSTFNSSIQIQFEDLLLNNTNDSIQQPLSKQIQQFQSKKSRYHRKSWQVFQFIDQIQKWNNIETNFEQLKIKETLNPELSQQKITKSIDQFQMIDGQLQDIEKMIDKMKFRHKFKPIKKLTSGDFYGYYICLNLNQGKEVLVKSFSKQLVLGCNSWMKKMSNQIEFYYSLKKLQNQSFQNEETFNKNNFNLVNQKFSNIISETHESSQALYLVYNDHNYSSVNLFKQSINYKNNTFDKRQYCKLIIQIIQYLNFIHKQFKICFRKISQEDLFIRKINYDNVQDENKISHTKEVLIQLSILNYLQMQKMQQGNQQIKQHKDYNSIINVLKQILLNRYVSLKKQKKNECIQNLRFLIIYLKLLQLQRIQNQVELLSLFQFCEFNIDKIKEYKQVNVFNEKQVRWLSKLQKSRQDFRQINSDSNNSKKIKKTRFKLNEGLNNK